MKEKYSKSARFIVTDQTDLDNQHNKHAIRSREGIWCVKTGTIIGLVSCMEKLMIVHTRLIMMNYLKNLHNKDFKLVTCREILITLSFHFKLGNN